MRGLQVYLSSSYSPFSSISLKRVRDQHSLLVRWVLVSSMKVTINKFAQM